MAGGMAMLGVRRLRDHARIAVLAAWLPAALSLVVRTGEAWAAEYDPANFAVEVVEYVEGTGVPKDWLTGIKFNNQVEAGKPLPPLRRPTVDTTGDGYNTGSPLAPVPVVSVNPPLRYYELVSIGEGRTADSEARPAPRSMIRRIRTASTSSFSATHSV